MSEIELRPQEQITLSIRHRPERIRFRTSVTDVCADYFAVDIMDAPSGKQHLLAPADEVRGTIIRYDALYHFKSHILEVVQEEQLKYLHLVNPESIWREQRRQYFRVEHRLPIQLQVEYINQAGITQTISVHGSIVNISAGGVKILVELPQQMEIKRGMHILLSFSIEEFTFKDLVGEVRRIEKSPGRHLIALIFIDPELDTQHTITRLNILYERRHILG